MKKDFLAIVSLLLFLSINVAARQGIPPWVDEIVRGNMYPGDEFYTGFVQSSFKSGDDVESLLEKMTLDAKRQLSESIIVSISGKSHLVNKSESISVGNINRESFSESYTEEMKSSTNTVITNSEIKSFVNRNNRMAYVLAIVNKATLESYYSNTIDVLVGKASTLYDVAVIDIDNAKFSKAKDDLIKARSFIAESIIYSELLNAVNSDSEGKGKYQDALNLARDIDQFLSSMGKGPSVFIDYSYIPDPSDNPLEYGPESFLPTLEQALSRAGFAIITDKEGANYILSVSTSTSVRSKPSNGKGLISYYANVKGSVISAKNGAIVAAFSFFRDPKLFSAGPSSSVAAERAFNREELYQRIINKIVNAIEL